MVAILSLSLLTVMAGAAVAPALSVIQEYFNREPAVIVKLIISMPALCIALTNLFFARLCRIFRAKTLTLIGLSMYVVFCCLAGACSNIYMVLVCRALLGVGVGIIMPMSTGLITYFFTKDKQDALMGYSSSMNMMGGVVATLIAGGLAMVSWRLSFAVYLMGFVSIIPVAMWMPNEKIISDSRDKHEGGTFRKYYPYIICMFLLMLTFFNYPANFALECSNSGFVRPQLVPVIMALMDIFGFFGGLIFSRLIRVLKGNMKYLAPMMFLCGYLCLEVAGNLILVLLGSFLVGAAIGAGVPFLISTASMEAGDKAAMTVIPALSVALYLAQFTTPIIIMTLQKALSAVHMPASSYAAAVLVSVLMIIWSSIFIKPRGKQ